MLEAPVSGASHATSGRFLHGILARDAPGDGGWEHWKTFLHRELVIAHSLTLPTSYLPANGSDPKSGDDVTLDKQEHHQ